MKYIERTEYLQRLIDLEGTPDIKIITGIRRSGKSKLMEAYVNYLKKNNENANIIFIDFFDIKFEPLKEYHKLNDYVESHYKNDKDNYLFIELFKQYTIKGGLAGSYAYKKEQDRIKYISEVYNTIVNRDLVTKYNLPDTYVLDHLAEYLMDNVSNLTSPNKVSDTLTSNKIITNHVTVGKYVKYLCNAFMFYDIKRYDIKGKKYLDTSDKYYLCDVGFRYALFGSRNMDYGRLYENIVCIELLRRGYEIYIGKLYQKEVDFIAKRGSE